MEANKKVKTGFEFDLSIEQEKRAYEAIQSWGKRKGKDFVIAAVMAFVGGERQPVQRVSASSDSRIDSRIDEMLQRIIVLEEKVSAREKIAEKEEESENLARYQHEEALEREEEVDEEAEEDLSFVPNDIRDFLQSF